MMLAFKRASVAAQRESGPGKLFSLGIARVTGGEFSHVELVLERNEDGSYLCFSAREPEGTDFRNIDLTDTTLWVCVPIDVTPEQLVEIKAWCRGRRDRRYNFQGIEGIAAGAPWTDPHDDFCSQCVTECLQDNLGMFVNVIPYWVAPSGFSAGDKRHGLYELVTAKQGA